MKAKLAIDPQGTVTEQLIEEGAQRYINVVANKSFRNNQDGKIQLDLDAKEKVNKLTE
jgi:hypothetical protein